MVLYWFVKHSQQSHLGVIKNISCRRITDSIKLSRTDAAGGMIFVPAGCVPCCLLSGLCWFWCWFFTLGGWSGCSGGAAPSGCFNTSRNWGTGNSAALKRQEEEGDSSGLNLTLSRYFVLLKRSWARCRLCFGIAILCNKTRWPSFSFFSSLFNSGSCPGVTLHPSTVPRCLVQCRV